MTKKNLKIFLVIITSVLLVIFLIKISNKKTIVQNSGKNLIEDNSSSSNIMENLKFSSKDPKGNLYSLEALEGEVNFSNNKIIDLKNVNAQIDIIDHERIMISSDFGKYNSINFDTVFSKNVIISYLDNRITGEIMKLITEDNLIIISGNVVYSSLNNNVKSDVIEIDINTRDVKIFMHDKSHKIKIKNKN